MIFDYSYRLSHIWFSTCFPVVFHFMFYSFLICTVFFPIFFLYVRLLFVPHSYLHLFSICSSIIFRLFFICFQFVLRLFSTFLIFVFHLSPFILRSFFISSSFVLHLFFHLFSIYFPFIFYFIPHLFFRSFAILSWSQIWFVRGQGSIPFCRMIDFPLEISSKPANGCQGETQSFPGKTLHVRLGFEIREL